MTGPGFRSIVAEGQEITILVDGVAMTTRKGRSLLAGLLLLGREGVAADFHCAIGQCQRCAVLVDGRPGLACMVYPQGGETVSTLPRDGRAPPWQR